MALRFLLMGLSLLSTMSWAENSLTLFVIPPPKKLSWQSPRSITSTALISSLKSQYHPIGHVTVKVDCSFKGRKVAFWTGMTSSKNNPSDNDLLLREKLGLSVFFYSYKGHLESQTEILADLAMARDMRNRLFTLKFLINEDHCERVHTYFEEYKAQRVNEVYGLAHRPRYLEGAGCTAYAMSFLEVAGLLDPELQGQWGRAVRVPESLMGNPQKRVSLTKLLGSKTGKRWAQEHEAHRKLRLYDTSDVYDWAQTLLKAPNRPTHIRFDRENHAKWHRYIHTRVPNPNGKSYRRVLKSNGYFGWIIDRRHWAASNEDLWFN